MLLNMYVVLLLCALLAINIICLMCVCCLFVLSLCAPRSLSQSLAIRCFVVDLYNKHKPTNLVVNNRSDTFGLACLSQLLVNHCIDY
jgi:hypothetical protein